MSSVTRFLTQVNPSASIFSAGNAVANPATAAYEFIPASGNTVGNYPPGYVQLVPASVSALLAALTNPVLRDMGKTIYAGIGATPTAYGRFRQVQVLVPQVGNNNFIGGAAGATGGVVGGPAIGDAYTNYMVIYLPVINNGMVASATVSTSTVLAGANQL
jgi:hypothetical protein